MSLGMTSRLIWFARQVEAIYMRSYQMNPLSCGSGYTLRTNVLWYKKRIRRVIGRQHGKNSEGNQEMCISTGVPCRFEMKVEVPYFVKYKRQYVFVIMIFHFCVGGEQTILPLREEIVFSCIGVMEKRNSFSYYMSVAQAHESLPISWNPVAKPIHRICYETGERSRCI